MAASLRALRCIPAGGALVPTADAGHMSLAGTPLATAQAGHMSLAGTLVATADAGHMSLAGPPLATAETGRLCAPSSGGSTPRPISGGVGGGLEVNGVPGGAWVLRAPSYEVMADALASVERPPERLRVEIGPVRF